jgi:uncharacterized protein (DUF433 family)
MKNRDITWTKHIVSNDNILLGKPTIAGTRITVEHIIDILESDITLTIIRNSYPHLADNDIKAVFAFIKECVRNFNALSNSSDR